LGKVENMEYDIIVIDEVEQVLGHFLAETLGEKRRRIFQIFSFLIRLARQVIVLDADLSWPSFKTIEIILSENINTLVTIPKDGSKTPIRVYLNNWRDEKRSINIFGDHDHLVHELKDAILSGQRIFVTSNSKRKIDAFEQIVKQLEEDAEIKIPHVSITSANSKTTDIQKLIRNIKTEILNYQVVMCSPSLGTGVDITFENGAQKIDRVFGFFEARVTSHFEIDQQLARVRNPKQIDVWVSPQSFYFETQFEVVVDDLLRSDLVYSTHIGIHLMDRGTLAEKDPFLAMAALVVSKDRDSKNNLKSNFIHHKRQQGWQVHSVDKDEMLSNAGLTILSDGQARSVRAVAERILNSRVLDEQEFKTIKRRLEQDHEVVSNADRSRYDRTRLELFYRQAASADLIEFDDYGRARGRILLFEALIEFKDQPNEFKKKLEFRDNRKITRSRVEVLKDRDVGAALLYEILSTTPLFKDGRFLPDVEYTTSEFQEFVALSRTVRRFVEGQFEVPTRGDLEKKPIQHLDALLKLLDLGNNSTRSQKIKGKKIYYYELDRDSLTAIEEVVRRRAEIDGWESVNERYGFEPFKDDWDSI
jgi:hypothetical protein